MNNAILKFTNECIDDTHGLLPSILLSNNIKFIAFRGIGSVWKSNDIVEVMVSSSVHFKEGFGMYSLNFDRDIDGWITLKEIKLEELL